MTAEIRAAGAVVWRGEQDAPEVALVHRPRYDDWTFPKGKAEPGEPDVAAALREVREETGLDVVLGRPLDTRRYAFRERPKRVRYWTARALSGSFAAGDETDALAWLPVDEARERLTYPRDHGLLDELLAAPLVTVPQILVRHGTAGSRDAWHGPDHLRPLDDHGRDQARLIAAVLPAWRPAILLSSPSLRCVQTLEPYSMDMLLDPLLSEEGMDREKTADLAARHEPVALCTHGEVLSSVFGLTLEKGELVVHHRAGDEIVASERVRI